MSRPTPADFQAIIPSPSSSMCGNFVKALLRLPVLIWQYISDLEGTGGGALAAIPRTGDLIFSAAPVSSDATRLLCDGSEYSRTDYANLYIAIGDLYGTPSTTANFKVPDFRARFPVGVGMFPAAGSAVLGTPGGEDQHILTVPEMPKHHHFIMNANKITGVGGGDGDPLLLDASHTLDRQVIHAGDSSVMFHGAGEDPNSPATVGLSSDTGIADPAATPPVGGHNTIPPFIPCYVYVLT